MINQNISVFLEDCWRLTPARMAEHLTRGKFQRYRHIQYLEKKIAQAVGKGGARLIISMPPRHGKSWLASLYTPAWFLSLWPEKNVILSSHDQKAAEAWSRSVRDFLIEHHYELSIDVNKQFASSTLWNTAQGGGMLTSGVGGTISASGNQNGGNLLILDDPLSGWKQASSAKKRQEQIDWFNSSFYTRAEPDASIIVVMTRWHERDLAGYLEHEHGDEWEVLKIPALAEDDDLIERAAGTALCEERFNQIALQKIRSNLGSDIWNSLYQQSPGKELGTIIKRNWWKYYRTLPQQFDEVLQSWDMAFKDTKTSDYVVGQVWGRVGANKYLIDQVRGRMDFQTTLRAVEELAEKYPGACRKLIEDKANGAAVISSLRDRISGLVTVQPDGGKKLRVNAISSEIESGNVFLPDPTLNSWSADFVNECAEFPNGKHDDQVDAMVYALRGLRLFS